MPRTVWILVVIAVMVFLDLLIDAHIIKIEENHHSNNYENPYCTWHFTPPF